MPLEKSQREQIKQQVLDIVAGGRRCTPMRKMIFLVSGTRVHVRFCFPARKDFSFFTFTISPVAMKADYEIWICGSAAQFYLVPTSIVQHIYDDPDAYTESAHPEIRVVYVDVKKNKAAYTAGGKAVDLKAYRGRVLR